MGQKDLCFVALLSVVECAVWYFALHSFKSTATGDQQRWRRCMYGLTALKLACFARALVAINISGKEGGNEKRLSPGEEALTVAFFTATFEFRRWDACRHTAWPLFDRLALSGGTLRAGFAVLFGAAMAWRMCVKLTELQKRMQETTEAKNKLAQLAGKLDKLVKALAVAGIVGVAFTLGDCHWAVESPTHWFT